MWEVKIFLNYTEAFQAIKRKIADMQTQGKTVMVLGTKRNSFVCAVADEMRESASQSYRQVEQYGNRNSDANRR